ncbi:hypothetical protein KC19_8G075200 [Ceratodon purpureus]|uniref:Sm domain-containing protein n=1 Tax=Ceratodon purpureus TaxID=3225 RepID=A0A8T0GYR9_CERPU|nr:hypothetical protein KC19_N017600 [Ceratodon purpureus]KAG0564003.1 hypothetical protein KC19_8G075200 [Ceratodon purpureus]
MADPAPSPSPCLDFFSLDFDALAALRTEGLQPPNPRVRPLDNLNKCRRILPSDVPESLINAPVREPRSQESIAAQQRAKARTSLILEKAAERARQARVLDTIVDKLRQGPLGLLVRCYEERARIQVWTRHTHGIRGTMVGFVRAVDKHFNMVMHDVDEQYSVLRRVPRLVNKRGRVKVLQHEEETSENAILRKAEDENDSQRKEQSPDGIDALTDKIKELKLFPKLEYRRRHLKQVFLRGDSVVMVRKLV